MHRTLIQNCELLVTQGHYGVDTRRASRRDVTGSQCDKRQHKSHSRKRDRVKWAHAKKESAH